MYPKKTFQCITFQFNIQTFKNSFFQRGDSLDTIFASSPPMSDCERGNRVKSKTKKRSSPRRRRQLEQQQESTDQEITMHEPISHRPTMRNSSSMIIDDVTGNIAQLPDSVILRIDSTDTSSSIDDDIHEEEEEADEYVHEG